MSKTFLVLSAHPDDAELSCSGTVRKLTNTGNSVVFVECTRGERGSRGTVETRDAEARAAANILGVNVRECLQMPDGGIHHTDENIMRVVESIRAHRPHVLLIPPPFERHPDHEAVHRLARSAAFLAGLPKVHTKRNSVAQLPWRPQRMVCFMQQYDFPRSPDFYIDITDTFQDKMESIRAHASQFHSADPALSAEAATFISRPEFLQEIEARALYFGSRIGTRYAEAFLSIEPLALDSLSDLL